MIATIVCSFIGTIAFSILYHVPSKYYKYCGFTGMVGSLCLYVCSDVIERPLATFLATLLVVFCSRIFAVWRKCPITVFLISGIFSLVPGSAVYYTAYNFVMNDLSLAVDSGIYALKVAFSVVLGIVFVVSIPRQWFSVEYWKKRVAKKRVVS
ncbi:MAG: threonine/serine exporter family protein [Tyzzerella sp.]|nr:threonine/serine exporter family protein [Tyzzerella sp.]